MKIENFIKQWVHNNLIQITILIIINNFYQKFYPILIPKNKVSS